MRYLLVFPFIIIYFSPGNIAFAQPGVTLNFDGVNDYIGIPHNNLLKPASGLTIEVWLKPVNIHSNKYYEIYRKEDAERHLFSFQEFGTVLSFGLVVNGVYAELDVPINPADYEGGWVHVAATFDGTVKKIYRNGALIGAQNITGSIGIAGTAPAFIGSYGGSGEFFNGSMDEFRLWNRGLTQSEIQTGMSCEFSGSRTGLLVYYKFNQGIASGANNTITSIIDSSGNNINGSLFNLALAGDFSNFIEPGGVQVGNYCPLNIYTFIGDGKWTDTANWKDKLIPPSTLESGYQIIIDPAVNGLCILDTLQFIAKGAAIKFAENKRTNISGDLYFTDFTDTKIPRKLFPFSIGSDVPAYSRLLIDSIYSAIDAVRQGSDTVISLINYKEEQLVFALNGQKEIMLADIFNKADTTIRLDAKSTAIAVVRFTLNPAGTGDMSALKLNTAIKAAPSFDQLVNTIQQELNKGNSIFSNDSVITSAEIVGNEIVTENGGLILGRPKSLSNQRYYFIDGIFKGENLWFEDVPGPYVNFYNDTRLFWQVTSSTEDGVIINPKKELEWEPFKWQEIIPALNPPTETNIRGAYTQDNSGKFKLTVEQDVNTKTKHCIFLIQNFVLALLDWFGQPGATYATELECSGEVAKAILNEKLVGVLTQTTGTAALQYLTANFSLIDAPWYHEKLKKCGMNLPSLADAASNKFAKQALLNLVNIWTKIQFAISAGTTIKFATQMARYWNYTSTQSFCKIKGNIVPICTVPILSTTPPTSISETGAVSGGNITDDGGSPVVAYGICWSTNHNPTISDSKTIDGSGIAIFTSTIEGLSLGNTYYARAYATNSDGTGYGEEVEIVPCGAPVNITNFTFLGTFNNHKYFLSDNASTWTAANATAITLNGHLVTINSAAENSFISSATNAQAWIGFKRISESSFEWVTGEPVTFTGWSSGEPNNSGGMENFAITNWTTGTWNDLDESVWSERFIIEFECE